jgi:Zn-dependent alcohol dehydrogenase
LTKTSPPVTESIVRGVAGNSGSGVSAGVVSEGGEVGIVGVGVVGVVDVQPLKAAIIVIIKIITNAEKTFLPTNRWSCVILIFPLTGLNRRTTGLWHC